MIRDERQYHRLSPSIWRNFVKLKKSRNYTLMTFENKSSFTHLTPHILSASMRILVLLTVQTKPSKSPKGSTNQSSSYRLKKKIQIKRTCCVHMSNNQTGRLLKSRPITKNEKAGTVTFLLRARYYIRAWNKNNGTRNGRAS